ncbi:hypothetical protein V6N11_037762 [Hibiscus sabdariffa]|uniref:Uncharacterized protein n=1 Tax=Hibiscus sabdariffa TaxID=183260 RepID=A0ABR2PF05_9ROSI
MLAFKDLWPVVKLSLSSGVMLNLSRTLVQHNLGSSNLKLEKRSGARSVQQVPSWVAVGAGWLSTVAWVNIGSYYLVVIPIGVVLGYVLDMHLNRVWVGMLLGTLLQTVVLIVITCKTDWDKHVVLPRNRVNKWFVSKSTEENGDNTENIVS